MRGPCAVALTPKSSRKKSVSRCVSRTAKQGVWCKSTNMAVLDLTAPYFLAVGGWKSIDFLGLVVVAAKFGTPKSIEV